MKKTFLKALAVAATAATFGLVAQAANADAIDDIKTAGVLKVGVKADYKPYGFLDPSGAIVGILVTLVAVAAVAAVLFWVQSSKGFSLSSERAPISDSTSETIEPPSTLSIRHEVEEKGTIDPNSAQHARYKPDENEA